MNVVKFETKLRKIGSRTILRLPKEVSSKLPSRGIVMVKGTLNGASFQTVLEPDGKGSHWLSLDEKLLKSSGAGINDLVTTEVEPTKEWAEPEVPKDIESLITTDTKANKVWTKITPMARWEWIRWIRHTNSPQTRQRRIEVARSKLAAGMRRPCCFNSNVCTDPSVSKSGVLLDTT